MTTQLTVEVNGLQAIEGKLKNPQLVAAPLKTLLTDLGLLAQRVARQEAPRDTAGLQRSLGLEVKPLYATVSTALNYAPVMEFGRRPGARMPPPDALAGWARRHGLPASALFVLARAIGRRGIKGRFFMAKAKTAVEAALPGRVDKMGKEIEKLWGGR